MNMINTDVDALHLQILCWVCHRSGAFEVLFSRPLLLHEWAKVQKQTSATRCHKLQNLKTECRNFALLRSMIGPKKTPFTASLRPIRNKAETHHVCFTVVFTVNSHWHLKAFPLKWLAGGKTLALVFLRHTIEKRLMTFKSDQLIFSSFKNE